MVERKKEVGQRDLVKEGLETRLSRHPHLKARIESLLDVIDNAGNDVERANAAERRVIEELRKMGSEALHGWAESQARKKSEGLEQSDTEVNKKTKKNSTGIRLSEQ